MSEEKKVKELFIMSEKDIETEIKEFSKIKIIFEQIIKKKETGVICNIAEITAVATDLKGNLKRNVPDDLRAAFEAAINSD